MTHAYDAPATRVHADPTPLAHALRWLLPGYALVQLPVALVALAASSRYAVGDRDRAEGLRGLYTALDIVALLICAVVFLRWTYRTVAAARAADPAVTLSPGWAVGWYFVPVLSWWRPYHSLRVAWLSGETRRLGHAYAPPGVFQLWWGLWLAGRLVGRVGDSLGMSEALTARSAGADLDVLAAVLNGGAALAAAAVVRRLAGLQAGL